MKTVIAVICSTFLLLMPTIDFDVSPKEISFEVKNARVIPKSALVVIKCTEETPWKAEYPDGFGGEKEGIGPKNLIIHPLGKLDGVPEKSTLKISSDDTTKEVIIDIKREKIINFDLRIFPEKRSFHPGGFGEFVFLLTCPDKSACGQIKFTEPAEKPSNRVAVIPNYLTPPGVAKIAMSSSKYTKPGSNTLPVKAASKNRKFSGTIKSDVVALGGLPEKPDADVSTEKITFIPGLDETEKIITIKPNADQSIFRWEAMPDKPWIDFEPTQGKGAGRIKVKLYKDGLIDDVDSGKIILTFPGVETIKKEIAVELLPNPTDHFNISPNIVYLGPLNTLFKRPTISVDVLPNVSWEVTKKPEWLTLSQKNGIGESSIYCDIKEGFESGKRMLEESVTFTLSEFKDSAKKVDINYLTTSEFFPEKITCKKTGNIYKSEFFCASFDKDETLFFMQPKNGWIVRANTSSYPKVELFIQQLWGDDNSGTLRVFRNIPGFSPKIYSLPVSLVD